MLDPTAEQFDVAPSRLVADAGLGSAEMIEWLVDERGIEPQVKLMDKSKRKDGNHIRAWRRELYFLIGAWTRGWCVLRS